MFLIQTNRRWRGTRRSSRIFMSNGMASNPDSFVPDRLYPSAIGLTSTSFPGPVFHYTDQAGFLGIIRSKAIWATDLRYLNDSQEYSVGFERIASELKRRSAGDPGVSDLVDGAFQSLALERVVGVGVTSFSLAGDDLSQWRAYGGGTGGICLGFEPATLALRVRSTGSTLGRVRYLEDEHTAIVHTLCSEIIGDAQLVLAGSVLREAFQLRCLLSVQLACALMKHAKFADEREWRMIVWSQLPPFLVGSFRPGRSMLLPYVATQLDLIFTPTGLARFNRLPLSVVWIGPTPHPALAARSAFLALQSCSETAQVLVSEVPFRNW